MQADLELDIDHKSDKDGKRTTQANGCENGWDVRVFQQILCHPTVQHTCCDVRAYPLHALLELQIIRQLQADHEEGCQGWKKEGGTEDDQDQIHLFRHSTHTEHIRIGTEQKHQGIGEDTQWMEDHGYRVGQKMTWQHDTKVGQCARTLLSCCRTTEYSQKTGIPCNFRTSLWSLPMDVKDFQRLFLPLRHKLYRFALKFVQDQMAAEDIVQEVFLRVWNKGQEMVELDHPEAYCMTMTRNLSLNYLKAKSRQNVGLDSVGQQAGTHVAADRMMEINERIVELKAHIRTLSERQQLVLHLREVEELTYDEISTALDISLAMVKSELFRARQNLKKKMERHG